MTGDAPQAAGTSEARAELDAVRERVMNVVGHALRTPMATVRGQVEVLAQTADDRARDRLIASLLESSRRLEELLDDVLVAAGIDTRLPVGSAQVVDAREAVEQAWASVGSDRPLALDVAGPSRVKAQPEGLTWMLRHLIDNVVRYGTGAVEVTIAADGGAVTIDVGGAGPDLPDDELRGAFELFYRGHHAVTVDGARMGVGLPVVRQLASTSDAEVSLDRRRGGGTVATLRLVRA